MANTLNNIGTQIAQKSLDLLVNYYPGITLLASNFSDEQGNFGETIKTRVINPGSAADYSTTSGYYSQDLSTTAVSVVLNKHKHATFTLNAQELAASSPKMINDYANLVAREIGDAFYSDIAALFTTGNYGGFPTNASTIVGTAGDTRQGFTGCINAANTSLSIRKVPIDRLAIYSPTLYGAMFNDSIVRTNYQTYVIGDTQLPKIQDCVFSQYADLPTTANLLGVQLHKSAVAIATRLPQDVSNLAGTPSVANVSTVQHPDLGIALQVRSWEDPRLGSLNVSATLMYGVSVGNSGACQLIRSS